ncbi:SNF2 family DNA or RNA helicase [Knoellia remsis]|uniref:SNF2 family DNA or RNA helicase n=1 Tax=Knoellia remsis TaxID=407159 RepID=A0A2T0UCG8_9MICO|nr:DEAD/DEAH box helicase [Knoellia remsis]PRY55636.1 SNF2 family DNA or RNA helicase [Knoellia remsis]
MVTRAFDKATRVRGADYARAGRVTSLVLADAGRRAAAKVIGSGSSIYRTEVALEIGDDLAPYLDSDCTCPIGVACKHAVAVVHAVRTQQPWRVEGEEPPTASAPAWQNAFDELLATPAAGSASRTGTVGIVLDVEPATRRPKPWQHGADRDRIMLRPVVPGAQPGRWIKTGISWEEVAGAYYSPYHRPIDDDALDALTAIADAYRRGSRMSGYGRMPASLALAQVGRGWVTLLARARGAGVALLTSAKDGGEVHLDEEPGHFVVDLTPAPEGGVRVEPSLDLPPGDGQVVVVGEPPTGWFRREGDDLRLGGFGPDVDLAAARFVERGGFTIPESDWPVFAMERLPALQRRATVRVHDGLDVPEVTPPRLHLNIRFAAKHTAHLEWSFHYGPTGSPVVVPVRRDPYPARDPHAYRDPDAEAELLELVPDWRRVPALWELTGIGWVLREAVSLKGFETVAFAAALPELEAHDQVEVVTRGERPAYQEVTEAPRIAIGTTQSEERNDWFDLSITVTVGDHEVPLADLVTALARDESRLLLPDGAWFTLDHPELHKLRALVEEARSLQDKASDPLRLSVLHAGLWDELVEIGVVEEQSAAWQRSVDALLGIGTDAGSGLPPAEVPSALKATLRPYQEDGFRWLSLLWDLGLGGVLADDMGLGKTLQVIATALRAKDRGELTDPMLIVAPTSVLATWVGEVERFAPDLTVAVLDRTRGKARVPIEEAIAGADLVVTTYAVARIDAEEFRSVPWSAAVLDEAQFVKNHQAKTYAAMRRLPARVTFALTGTPLENSLMDLWSLLSIVAPGLHPRPQLFKEQWARPIEKSGDAERLATLRRRIRPLMLRRTKEAVAADLPPKQEQVLHVALDPKHRAIYDRHLSRERQRLLGLIDDVDGNRILILRALTVLRQMALDPALVDAEAYGGIASSAKVEALVEQVSELAAEGHRALVFSQFTGFLSVVRERLEAEGIDYAYLDGRTRGRTEVVRSFREGDAPVFLISLKAGGFGLTLTEADYVFVLDPWWNPAAENQAIDRAHRIGQTKSVNVYRMVSTDTIEEKVVALQERKRDLFAKVVDEGAALSSAITADDLRALLER